MTAVIHMTGMIASATPAVSAELVLQVIICLLLLAPIIGIVLLLRYIVELRKKTEDFSTFLTAYVEEEQKAADGQVDQAVQAISLVSTQLNERIAEQTKTVNEQLSAQAKTVNEQLGGQTQALNERLAEQAKSATEGQQVQTATLSTELKANREEMSKEFAQVRETMEARLKQIQLDNTTKLDEMRATVDEKLSETLEKRFSESFTLISDRLESVQRGLGEMQQLAGSVTALNNVLANVKTRGNFGEYQLQTLLEDVFTPDQYEVNFAPKPRSQQRVEFAIRMPGKSDDPVWLPIDSKFPIESYQRLLDAYESNDPETMLTERRTLLSRTRRFAMDIRDKYLNPPRTTDFAVMFVPTEGLYAELLREPGFADEMLRSNKVLLAGPSTFMALISSLQVGFSTVAIEKRSSEIEKLLGAVKSDFSSFEKTLEKVDQRLEQARTEIGTATRRSSTIQRRLRDVTGLPADESAELLEAGGVFEDTDIEVEVLEVEDIFEHNE